MSKKTQQKITSVLGTVVFIGALLAIIVTGIINPEKSNTSDYTAPNNSANIEEENQKQSSQNYITIKYRNDPVDVSGNNFEELDLGDLLNKYADQFSTGEIERFNVRNAWYDHSEEYLIINLRGTNYHYCEMPVDLWDGLKRVGSVDYGSLEEMDVYYKQNIKGNYDCRINRVPTY